MAQLAGQLLKRLRDALNNGTTELAAAIWQLRPQLLLVLRAAPAGDAPQRVEALAERIEQLTEAPDSAATVKIWAELEPALAAFG